MPPSPRIPARAHRKHPVKEANRRLFIPNGKHPFLLTVPASQNEWRPDGSYTWQREEQIRWMAWLQAVFTRTKLHMFKETTAYQITCADGTSIPLHRFIHRMDNPNLPATSGQLITLIGQVTRIYNTRNTHRLTLSGNHANQSCELILSRFTHAETTIRQLQGRWIACCGYLHTKENQRQMNIHSLPHQLTLLSGDPSIPLPLPRIQPDAITQAMMRHTPYKPLTHSLVRHTYATGWRSLVSDLNQDIRILKGKLAQLQKLGASTEREWRKQQAKYKASKGKWNPQTPLSLWSKLGLTCMRKNACHERDQAFFHTFAHEILSLSRKRRFVQEKIEILKEQLAHKEAEWIELNKLTWLEKDFVPPADAILHLLPLTSQTVAIVATCVTVTAEEISLRSELYVYKYHGDVPCPCAKLSGPSVKLTHASFPAQLQSYWSKVQAQLRRYRFPEPQHKRVL